MDYHYDPTPRKARPCDQSASNFHAHIPEKSHNDSFDEDKTMLASGSDERGSIDQPATASQAVPRPYGHHPEPTETKRLAPQNKGSTNVLPAEQSISQGSILSTMQSEYYYSLSAPRESGRPLAPRRSTNSSQSSYPDLLYGLPKDKSLWNTRQEAGYWR